MFDDRKNVPTLSAPQTEVLFAEIRAIRTLATKAAILSADTTAQFRGRLDAAIESGAIAKDFLSELATALAIQEASVLAAIAASNLVVRIEGDLAPTGQGA
jgi:hypothetical protein